MGNKALGDQQGPIAIGLLSNGISPPRGAGRATVTPALTGKMDPINLLDGCREIFDVPCKMK